MRNNRVEVPNDIKSMPAARPEIDYSPKTYTLRGQIASGVKLLAAIGIIFLLLWLFDAKSM